MSISIGPPYIVRCDAPGCRITEQLEARSFSLALDELKENGWQSKKVNKDWFHYCAGHKT